MVAADFALLSLAVLSAVGFETAQASKFGSDPETHHGIRFLNISLPMQNHDLDAMPDDYSNETRPMSSRKRSSRHQKVP